MLYFILVYLCSVNLVYSGTPLTTPFTFLGSSITSLQVADNRTLYLYGTRTVDNKTYNTTSLLSLPWPYPSPTVTQLHTGHSVLSNADTDFTDQTAVEQAVLEGVLEGFNRSNAQLLVLVTWNGTFTVNSKSQNVTLTVSLIRQGASSLCLVRVGQLIKVKAAMFNPRQVQLKSVTSSLTLKTPSVYTGGNTGTAGLWLLHVDPTQTTHSIPCPIKKLAHSTVALYNSTHLYYTCDKGYSTVYNSSAEFLLCNKGSWEVNKVPTRQDVTCYQLVCPKLQLDPVGTVGIDVRKYPVRPIGAAQGSVKYYCSHNYYIEKDKARNHCYSNGTWQTGQRGPTCHLNTDATCSSKSLPHPENTNLLTPAPYNVTTSAVFECCHGYHANSNTSVLCMDIGKWQSPVPFTCTSRAICSEPPPVVEHASLLTLSPYYVTTYIQYQCEDGYTNTSHTLQVECLVSGRWGPAEFSCNKTEQLFGDVKEMLIIAVLAAVTVASVVTACFCACSKRKKKMSGVILSHPIMVQEARLCNANSSNKDCKSSECAQCPEHVNTFCTQHHSSPSNITTPRISWVPVISNQQRKSVSYVNNAFEDF